MHNVAGTRDQDAFITQRRQAFSQVEMLTVGKRYIQAQLNDRDIRLWPCFQADAPGAMIESPRLIKRYRCRGEQFGNATCQRGVRR